MVYSANEWDDLKQVILGTSKNMYWPKEDIPTWDVLPQGEKVPDFIIEENSKALDEYQKIMESLGVEVLRPLDLDYEKLNGFGAYSTRDAIAIIGDKIIFTPTLFKHRRKEWEAIKPLFPSNSNFIYAPLDDPELIFDAANIIRCNNDILYLVSKTGTEKGAVWLQETLGNEYRVHILRNLYAGAHLDSTLMPIREGLIVVNGARCSEDHLPEFLKKWDQIWIHDDEVIDHPTPYKFSTKWLAINFLNINPHLAIVEPNQPIVTEKLNKHGVETIPLKIPHGRYLLGGHHCTTLDTIRG